MQMHPFAEKLELQISFVIFYQIFCAQLPMFSLSWFVRVEESFDYKISFKLSQPFLFLLSQF
jgi:hypothetical protein